MAKLRVYELAEQMNKTNKEILSILKDKGIEVASHMSTLSDEQIDAVKSEKTSEDTPKKKNIVQVFRPQNSQGGGRGRNGQGRQQGSRNGQRSQGIGNGQGRPQGNGNRQERPQNGNSQGRPQGNGQGRPQNGNRQERPQGNGNGQGRPQNGNRQDRPQGENRDNNRQRRNPNGPRNADSRTAETEEIIEITVITETEERCVMADAVTTEENPARLFRHLQSQNRNQAAINQKMRTRRKNITEMKRTKTDCRKAKRAKTITLSRKW